MKHQLIIANWKMQRPHAQAIAWMKEHTHELATIAKSAQRELVICPEFTALSECAQIVHGTTIAIGAQDCSAYPAGAHTGQVSAQSLRDAGCRYCIIGHSEQRNAHHESNEVIAKKMLELLAHGITPIICIGETESERYAGRQEDALRAQLAPILAHAPRSASFIIAYEPLWAIGNHNAATPSDVQSIITFLARECAEISEVTFLYGGSITPENYTDFLAIKGIEGLLVGSASLSMDSLRTMLAS